MDNQAILENVKTLATGFAQERSERQRRRQLDQRDFDQLGEAGFLLAAVPTTHGGTWHDRASSIRPLCEMLRALAHADPSLALVASMHPAVISTGGWLTEHADYGEAQESWVTQRNCIFQSIREGNWWGTIVSEPGTGGDPAKTQSPARKTSSDGQYLISGPKHFGSGSGVMSYMITTAVPEGEDEPDLFYMDVRGVPWDGSAGIKLRAAWDGHGMAATQSHAMTFENFPATRVARANPVARPFALNIATTMWAGIILGIVETAIATARQQLTARRPGMVAFQQVEWSRVEVEGWLIQHAYEGLVRDIETNRNVDLNILLGKVAIAELAETLLVRISQVVGGSTYSKHSPYGFWLEDVRALGFLRPPWQNAFDGIFKLAWDAPDKTDPRRESLLLLFWKDWRMAREQL